MAAERDSKGNSRIPLLESLAAGIGLALLVAMFAFLVYEAVKTDDGAPAVMVVEPTGVTSAAGQHVVEIKVTNRSRKTAAAVQVEGVLSEGGSDVETSNASLDYVPGKSQRQGAVVFSKDPRSHKLQLRITGYESP